MQLGLDLIVMKNTPHYTTHALVGSFDFGKPESICGMNIFQERQEDF